MPLCSTATKRKSTSSQKKISIDSYSQIHQLDDSSEQSKGSKRRSSSSSTNSYSEITETQQSKSERCRQKIPAVDYHSESRKLKDKNRKLLIEIDELKRKNKRLSTEMSVAQLKQSQTNAKKHDYFDKYTRLKEQYAKTMEELKTIKSKHIATLKHKNQLQTKNNSLTQMLRDNKDQLQKQSVTIQQQRRSIVESTHTSSLTLNDNYLHEMSGILDISVPPSSNIVNEEYDNNEVIGFHQRLLLEKGEEKMKLLKELEAKAMNLERENKELHKKLRRKQQQRASMSSRGQSESLSMDFDDSSSMKLQICEIRHSKISMHKRYERELSLAKKKIIELETECFELSGTQNVANENKELRRKIHQQRTDIAQLRGWKCLARKKYLEQIKEIRDDVQELQSRSRINQFKFTHLMPKMNKCDERFHEIESFTNNHEQILKKFNEVQGELATIIQTYANKKDVSIQQKSKGGEVEMDDTKHRKIYRNGMREIEKIFEITFDENDQISYNDICKIIEYIKLSTKQSENQRQQIEQDIDAELLDAVYAISQCLELNIERDNIVNAESMNKIKQMIVECIENKEKTQQIVADLNQKMNDEKQKYAKKISSLNEMIETQRRAVMKVNDELTQGMVEWEERYTKISEQLYQKSVQIKDLMAYKAKSESMEPMNECELQSLKEKITNLEQSIVQKGKTISALTSDLFKKQNEIKQITKKYEEKLKTLQQENKEIKSDFEAKIDKLQKEKDAIEQQMESEKNLVETIEALKLQQNECENLLKRRCEELNETNEQNVTLQRLYQKECADIKALAEKIRIHEEKENKLKESENNLQQRYDILQGKINELMEEKEQCSKESNAEEHEYVIENLQNQLEEYKKSISLKCAELAQLFKNNEEMKEKLEKMTQQNEIKVNRENDLKMITMQRDEIKSHYMALNEKYAAVLLELNEIKIKEISNDINVEQPSEADLYSSMLQTEIVEEKEPFQLDNFLDLVSDLNDNCVKQPEEEEETEDQKELNAYLKRVESMHGQFDSNLSFIGHAKNPQQSDSESETNSDDFGLLQ